MSQYEGKMIPASIDKIVIGDATLYRADCRDVLPTLGKVDAVVTDPPYGEGLVGGWNWRDKSILNDADSEMIDWLLAQNLERLIMFYSPYSPPIYKWDSILVWDKGGAVGGGGNLKTSWKRTFELIGVLNNAPLNGQRNGAVLTHYIGQNNYHDHPMQKPVKLMQYLIGKIKGDTILDPFMGSGTTGVAALKLGRKFIGIEIEKRFFDVAVERIKRENDQLKMF